MKTVFFSLVILFCACFARAGIPQEIAAELQGESVTIVNELGQGSGVMVTRQIGEDFHTFIWTAAHVVDGLQEAGKWKNVTIVQEVRQEGLQVGKVEAIARIIKFSREQDLALLQVTGKNFTKINTRFCLDGKVPACGTDVIHVGSLHGMFGHNSISQGIISQTDKHLDKDDKTFDQTSTVGAPGSSGGGVFLADGRYIGMLVRGARDVPLCNFIVPVRRIQDYAKAEKIEWAIDEKLAPTLEELSKLPAALEPTLAPPQIEIQIPGLPGIPKIPGINGGGVNGPSTIQLLEDIYKMIVACLNGRGGKIYCPLN